MATREFDLVFLGRRVITPDGEVPRCVAVRDGVVVAVEPYEAALRGATTVELADDEVLLPGLVDTHVHINEPGRTEWEGYATATIHAEDTAALGQAPSPQGRRYSAFLASRPHGSEDVAITQLIDAARRTGASVHLLHLSSANAVPMIRAARRDGVRMTVETCPHYLTFEAQAIADGATQFKCCPPIRGVDNREELWRALGSGDIDCIVSDHSPSTPELKHLDPADPSWGEFGEAWGGISSLQVGLSAVWTEARLRGHTLVDVVGWMAEQPARIAALRHKGRITPGYHADFAVFAPDDAFVVDPKRLLHRNPVTPYAQRALAGVVRSTWLRGQRILAEGEPCGQLISRGEA